VAEWIAHPEENHGWILTRAESDTGTGIQLASRNNPTVALHPTLTIAFALPTGACCDGTGKCEVVTEAECTAPQRSAGDDTKCATRSV
jgi:hypothetical protein